MVSASTSLKAPSGKVLPTGQERVRVLYEEYIHLPYLLQVWDHPVTSKPKLEPCFAAAFHGIELCFLLLAEFICDNRKYVAKRPRIERVAEDIRSQCQLLSEVVDGELEEDMPCSRLNLQQDFPFPSCPPTIQGASHSPGLARLHAAIVQALPRLSTAEYNSLCKVVLNITHAFTASFSRWTVGLGLEAQLNELLAELKMQRSLTVPEKPSNLDYNLLVQPVVVVERTLTDEVYTNAEDFFFRSVHLGTECWMFVALSCIATVPQLTSEGLWHVASARILQAARILNYLGDHVLLLTSMNLRDYLSLKVELEGTSGGGSTQVKAIRGRLAQLLEPFWTSALVYIPNPTATASLLPAAPEQCSAQETDDTKHLAAAMEVYSNPDKHPGLYNYAKSLEDVESALLGGFFFKHFLLAANVIGSDARGTMKRSVAGLKTTYEKPLFPVLDMARSKLGKLFDEQLAGVKGRMMEELVERYVSGSSAAAKAATFTRIPSATSMQQAAAAGEDAVDLEVLVSQPHQDGVPASSKGHCPVGGSAQDDARARSNGGSEACPFGSGAESRAVGGGNEGVQDGSGCPFGYHLESVNNNWRETAQEVVLERVVSCHESGLDYAI